MCGRLRSYWDGTVHLWKVCVYGGGIGRGQVQSCRWTQFFFFLYWWFSTRRLVAQMCFLPLFSNIFFLFWLITESREWSNLCDSCGFLAPNCVRQKVLAPLKANRAQMSHARVTLGQRTTTLVKWVKKTIIYPRCAHPILLAPISR